MKHDNVKINPELNSKYWNSKFESGTIGWDIGYVSPPLKEYFDQIENKNLKILIPGAGNAYEAEYLYNNGFKNVFILDFAIAAINSFINRFPRFPQEQIINANFFDTLGTYDLIIEQAFFTSFPLHLRTNYTKKIYELLSQNGKLIGLWFTHKFNNAFPPYGGTKEEYLELFSPYFKFKIFDLAYNSIKPRKGREFFILMQKKETIELNE